MKFDAIIIGGGAAGLMCAIEAGKRGRSVLVLEHAERLGKKILISGGGRCNFTNLNAGPEHFLSGNPHFCKSALARFTPADFLALVGQHGIAWHEKNWASCSATSVPARSSNCCNTRRRGVEIRLNSRRSAAEHAVPGETNGAFESAALVIATGGLSFPKIGATDFGYGSPDSLA
jgi:predicted Rossmann fold flavoprotein